MRQRNQFSHSKITCFCWASKGKKEHIQLSISSRSASTPLAKLCTSSTDREHSTTGSILSSLLRLSTCTRKMRCLGVKFKTHSGERLPRRAKMPWRTKSSKLASRLMCLTQQLYRVKRRWSRRWESGCFRDNMRHKEPSRDFWDHAIDLLKERWLGWTSIRPSS